MVSNIFTLQMVTIHVFLTAVLAYVIPLVTACGTDYGRGPPCVFPFRLDGQLYISCTTRPVPGSGETGPVLPPHCPTRVNPDTLEASTEVGDWGTCDRHCPLRNYRSNADITDNLNNIAITYPDLAEVFSIGRSVRGENLTGIRLSSGIRDERKLLKPMVALIGNMHGNEVVCREVLTHLASVLVMGMAVDKRIQAIMERTEVHILPTINPDGWRRAGEGECGGQDLNSGRLNSNRVDLNRNFPVNNVDRKRSSKHHMEPETEAVVNWLKGNPFVLGANFHGGAVVASYPWDHYERPQPDMGELGEHQTLDDSLFKNIAKSYAENNPAMSNSSSCKKYAWLGSTTNGAKWYPKNGTLKDFSYQQTNSLDFVFELSCCKYLRSYFLPREWDYNR